jgi:hypothetical protein
VRPHRRTWQQPAELAHLPLGAHLVTPRRGFVHHGIYAGAGRVVHYAGLSRSLRGEPVQEVSLEVFAGGRGVAIEDSGPARYAATEIVERARSRVDENRYHLVTNNCEHFCTWCRQGESRSEQVERLLRWPNAFAAALRRLGRALQPAATSSPWAPSWPAF